MRPFWYLRRRRDAVQAEVDEELRLHLELRSAALRAKGLPPDVAAAQALREFGDLESTRDYCREQGLRRERQMGRAFLVTDAWQDVKVSWRSLARSPALAVTIAITVGLGIGATTAMFAAADAALLRPLPYRDSNELVRIYTDAPPYRFRFSVADYLALDAQHANFSQVAGYTDRAMSFSDGQAAERVRGRTVSTSYFDLLGIGPQYGRNFVRADGEPGKPLTVILSHDFWQKHYGANPSAIGQSLRADGQLYTVTGVLPPAVGPLERGIDLFVAAQWTTPPRKGPFFITPLGRLANPAARGAAEAELHEINRRLFPIWKSSYQDERATWSFQTLQSFVAGDFRTIAGVALAAVAFVWIIAAVNASNLLLARVATRRRELAVRVALGASRFRVVRHLLTEAVVLASASALLAVGVAWVGIRLIRTSTLVYIPRAAEMQLGGRTLVVFLMLTFLSALLFGLIPGLHGSGGAMEEGLRASSRSSTGSLQVRRLRSLLVATQFAVAMPLLVMAALLVVTLNHLRQVEVGFGAHQVLTAGIALPQASYKSDGAIVAFTDELVRRVSALPGVEAAAFVDSRPPDDAGNQNNFDLEDSPAGSSGQPVTTWVAVTPEHFATVGVRLVEGRLLTRRDAEDDNLMSIDVDEAWARRFFPGQSAVGKRLREGGCTDCPWTTVVGVVTNVKYDGLNTADPGIVYWPLAPGSRFRYLEVRTGGDAANLLPGLRETVRSLDPSVPLADPATLSDLVGRSLQQPAGLSLLAGSFGAVALLLSLIGVYAVMSHHVEQRAREISIRMALGGRRLDVLQLIVFRGTRLVVLGIAVGGLLAFNVARLTRTLLFGVGVSDPLTFGVVAIGMLAAAVIACAWPAARAVSASPAMVLRQD